MADTPEPSLPKRRTYYFVNEGIRSDVLFDNKLINLKRETNRDEVVSRLHNFSFVKTEDRGSMGQKLLEFIQRLKVQFCGI